MQVPVLGPLEEVLSEFPVEFGKPPHRIKQILGCPPKGVSGSCLVKQKDMGRYVEQLFEGQM